MDMLDGIEVRWPVNTKERRRSFFILAICGLVKQFCVARGQAGISLPVAAAWANPSAAHC